MPKRTFGKYLACWTAIIAFVFSVGHNLLHGSEVMPTGLALLTLPGILAAALIVPDGVHSATPFVFAGIAVVVNWVVYYYIPVRLYWRHKEKRFREAEGA